MAPSLLQRRSFLLGAVLLCCLPLLGFECDQPQQPEPEVTAHLTLTPADPGIEEDIRLDPSRTEVIRASVRTFEYRIDEGPIPDLAKQILQIEQNVNFPAEDVDPATAALAGGQYTATLIAHYRDQFGRSTSDATSVTFWVSACGPAPYAGDDPPEEIRDDREARSSGVLPGAIEGSPYDVMVPVNGGVDPLRFSLADPVNKPLPDWLSLAEDGRLTSDETPPPGGATILNLRVHDSCFNGSRSVVLSYFLPIHDPECGPAPSFGGFGITELKRGYRYALVPIVEDGKPPFYLITPDDEDLPAGLGMVSGGNGTLSGRPLVVGTYTFELGVRDGCFRTDFAWVTLVVVEPVCEALVDEPDPPRATVGVPYSAPVYKGGYPPITVVAISAPIPPGLTLDSTTGILSGTPTTAGQSYMVFEVEDSCPEGVQSIMSWANLFVDPAPGDCPPMRVVTEGLPGAAQGWDYETTIEVDGGQPPLHFQELGALPPGISLDYGSGVLSGSPTAPGHFAFDIVVYDSCEPEVQSITRNYQIVVE